MKSIAQPCAGVNAPATAYLQPQSSAVVSDALQAANERLMALRARQSEQADTRAAMQRHAVVDALDSLPSHLGWGSAHFSRVLRCHKQSAGSENAVSDAGEKSALRIVINQAILEPPIQNPKALVKAYPTILNAMLKQEQAAAGRVWLLCRYLDSDGRGWIPVEALRSALTGRKAEGGRRKAVTSSFILHPSSFPIFGWRRLRQILGQGKGVFWDRDSEGRLWIFGAARVAANLGVERLQNRPIQLSIADLTGTIGQVRAVFYAAFHAGRPESQPISRAAIAEVTGVPARTQFQYEETAGMQRRHNFTIGAGWGSVSAENDAYQHGNAVFQFIDHRGRHGKCGQTYAARQLPNSYGTRLQPCTRGRQRKVNARLADLVTWGAGERPKTAERPEKQLTRLYYRDASTVAEVSADARQSDTFYCPLLHDRKLTYALWSCYSVT